ncbi:MULTISPECIES: hypothetical protein [unclassified Psychrobacter]|uniref:hypothetical protein n=1 Tax=unclassified Psychrobacter TaxID=196806 RepID=UPI00293D1EAC|nr:hypothetical protein [uncultured Psychrobacter sp.]
MPLRPIDAIFVNPKRRLYVVYYRGVLWQLPRMKVDAAAWRRRKPYDGDKDELYLSRMQAIADPTLAAKLRTLNLPQAVRGSTLARFEAWWETQGYYWIKDLVDNHQSPLAVHQTGSSSTESVVLSSPAQNNSEPLNNKDIFDTMLAELIDEVLDL